MNIGPLDRGSGSASNRLFPVKGTMLLEFVLGFAIAIFAWYLMTRLPADYPPTPPLRLPILGHTPYLLWFGDTKHTSALYEMFKRYSKNGVLTLHIGTERMTMLGKVGFPDFG